MAEVFEKAADFSFKEDDIDRAKALVGQFAPAVFREQLSGVAHDAMWNVARRHGDDNPRSSSWSTSSRGHLRKIRKRDLRCLAR